MNCLVVVNTLSGNYQRICIADIISRHTHPSDNITVQKLTNAQQQYHCTGYDKVIVCGGDGTLHHALNSCHNTAVKHLVYVSCGTLNECAHMRHMHRQVGSTDGVQFGYVLACGTLTQIGYTTKTVAKKSFKAGAYISQILRHYHMHDIPYSIATEQGDISGRATLIMFLHSDRCFGLPFNRMYDKENGKLYMLVLRSYGRDTLWNRMRMFIPLFRVFILGTSKPLHSKNIYFDSFDSARVQLPQDMSWTVDGERITLGGKMTITTNHPTYKLTIDRL